MTDRLPIEVFDLPVSEIRRGYRSAIYFSRSKKILEEVAPNAKVTMQVFQKKHAVACGVDEAIAILKIGIGHWEDNELAAKTFDKYMNAKLARRSLRFTDNPDYIDLGSAIDNLEDTLDDLWISQWDECEVRAAHDGDEITPWQPVLQITGPQSTFVHLESVYLGVLARRTRVATNARRVCSAANGKPVLFFADRFDHYMTQGGDGYAAHIGGTTGVATDAMGAWWGEPALGTMPHALIAAFGGNVVAATGAFSNYIPDVNLVALVDFNNDCVEDSIKCVREFGDKLWGVRLDTSETMVDRSIPFGWMGDYKPTGVNPYLVSNVRAALNANGGSHVKIIVSGGFTAEKITEFETLGVPVDSYAVGSSLLAGQIDYTADVVMPVAKKGRTYRGHNLEVVS